MSFIRDHTCPACIKKLKTAFAFFLAILTGSLAAFIIFFAPHYSFGRDTAQHADARDLMQVSIDTAPLEGAIHLKRRHVAGFLPYWTIESRSPVYLEYLDQLLYFGITIGPDGTFITKDESGSEIREWSILKSQELADILTLARMRNTRTSIVVKSFQNEHIDRMISSSASRSRAIQNILSIVRTYGFDGVNIDFEYFTQIDYPTMQYLNTFLQELSNALREENDRIILSFDVNATAVYLDSAYDMVKIGQVVDQVIIMGYDYHQTGSTRAGPNAPVMAPQDGHNLTKTIRSLKGRVLPEKIVLGIPFYGYEWATVSRSFGSPTIPNTGSVATYRRVRELIENRKDLTIAFDELSQTPWISYLQNGAIKQIYYEDEISIAAKIDLVHQEELGGVAVWSMGFEGAYQEPWKVIESRMWIP